MKKIILAAVALSAISSPAFAGVTSSTNGSASAAISASVPLVCTVTAPDGGTVAVTGTSAIGDASALCNSFAGFNATVSSTNGGFLKSPTAGNGTTIPYKIVIAGVTDGTPGGLSLATPQGFPGPAYVTGSPLLAVSIVTNGTSGPAYAGTYTDTITFSIAAN